MISARPSLRRIRGPIYFARRHYSVQHSHGGRKFRMAVIGSGPAGFYTSKRVMSKIENACVDMYEQLPVPYGLVRFGVAPDHPEVKNCQLQFEEVGASPNFNFIGNIMIGDGPAELPLQSLVPHYDAILFAYGASKDRTLGIPGEDTLKGIYSARAFVGWYNGLPEYAGLAPSLDHEDAVIVGQGNVALDVARILLQDSDALISSDITNEAIEVLRSSKVKRVRICGRRGPLHAAFTIKEVRELLALPSVAFHPIDPSLFPDPTTVLERPPRRRMELLKKGSNVPLSSANKSWSLDFCLSPKSFNADSSMPEQFGSLSFEKTKINPSLSNATAELTGDIITIPSSLAFRSIGYKSEPLPGFDALGIPFSAARGTITNKFGRIFNAPDTQKHRDIQNYIPGLYCAGWVEKGPTGVIATTQQGAFLNADVIADGWYALDPFLNGPRTKGGGLGLGWEGIKKEALQRGCRPINWQDWQRIDAAEKSRGTQLGKEREKFTKIDDMLAVLD